MELTFINFWHLYAPRKEFSNRYRACERLWQAMDEKRRALIITRPSPESPLTKPQSRNPMGKVFFDPGIDSVHLNYLTI